MSPHRHPPLLYRTYQGYPQGHSLYSHGCDRRKRRGVVTRALSRVRSTELAASPTQSRSTPTEKIISLAIFWSLSWRALNRQQLLVMATLARGGSLTGRGSSSCTINQAASTRAAGSSNYSMRGASVLQSHRNRQDNGSPGFVSRFWEIFQN